MAQLPRLNPPKIAYLIKCFPRLSETFILHEVLELERQGVSLRIFSLMQPEGKVNQATQEVQARTSYIPRGFPFGTLRLLGATRKRLLKSPWRFLRTVLIAIVKYHHPATPRHLLYAAYLANELEREGITHIHAHYVNTPATVANLAHHFTGISYSFTAHAKDIYLSRKASIAHKMQQASFVATCTAYNQRYLTEQIDQAVKTPVYGIYHGLNLRVFPALPVPAARQDPTPLILTVARLVEKKGLTYLLQACRILKDQGYNFRCRIVGEGPLRSTLEEQIRELDLVECVELYGAETHERVIEMYRQATLKALPCVVSENGDRDGIPNVLVEALYMGVPVISTPISGVPELIAPEENGVLVPARDSQALAGAMARLLHDPQLRQRLAAAGQQTVLESFDMARNVTRLKQLLLAQLEPEPASREEQSEIHEPGRRLSPYAPTLEARNTVTVGGVPTVTR